MTKMKGIPGRPDLVKQDQGTVCAAVGRPFLSPVGGSQQNSPLLQGLLLGWVEGNETHICAAHILS